MVFLLAHNLFNTHPMDTCLESSRAHASNRKIWFCNFNLQAVDEYGINDNNLYGPYLWHTLLFFAQIYFENEELDKHSYTPFTIYIFRSDH